MKKFKGIVFDFNGTLICDDRYHFEAFKRYMRKYGVELDSKFYFQNVHGSTNRTIYERNFKDVVPKQDVESFGDQKEVFYREMCEKELPPFANGAVEMLGWLKENKIPCAIATSSEISNITYFKEKYNLGYWFGDRIIYDDGTVRGKPYPDLYLKAAKKLGFNPCDLIMVEDSYSGAKACKNAEAGMVVGICPRGAEHFKGEEFTDKTITDFTDLDYKNLLI